MTQSILAKWQISNFQYNSIMLSQSLSLHMRETYWQNFSHKCQQISKRPTIKVILNVEHFLRHKGDIVKRNF